MPFRVICPLSLVRTSLVVVTHERALNFLLHTDSDTEKKRRKEYLFCRQAIFRCRFALSNDRRSNKLLIDLILSVRECDTLEDNTSDAMASLHHRVTSTSRTIARSVLCNIKGMLRHVNRLFFCPIRPDKMKNADRDCC